MSRKTVFITGAGRGIGQSTALRFAHYPKDFNIVINCFHNKAQLEHTAQLIRDLGAPCLPLIGDAGHYDSIAGMYQTIERQFGPVDIMINNAGIAHLGLLSDMTPQQWDQVIRTNLTSVFNCCHQVIPAMVRRQSGKIINISSVWGNVGASCEVAYSASKGGINALTKALAKELAPSHIQVNAIACGVIDTQMNQLLSEEDLVALVDEIPACRMGTPDDVADLIFDLATGHPYLTGQIITLDGGWI